MPASACTGASQSQHGCVSVSANDKGDSGTDGECPKARCALAMDPGTYTVGSWGETNYDARGYKSYNNKGVVVVKPEEPQPTKPTQPEETKPTTKPSKGN